jgi:hypothetical protein
VDLARHDRPKAHALKGKTFHVLRGPTLIPPVLAIVAITAVSSLLNAAFGFAIAQNSGVGLRP